jgi:CHAT domain-containing protein/tetratricopeptide (TPR) repeat protein
MLRSPFAWIQLLFHRAKARHLNHRGDHERAARHAAAGAAVAARHYGEHSDAFAIALNDLGMIDLDRGGYAEAQRSFERVLEILDSRQTPDALRIATIRANLGSAALSMGDIVRAEAYLVESLRTQESLLDKHDRRCQASRQALATLYKSIGNAQRAVEMRRQVVEYARNDAAVSPAFLVARLLDLAGDLEATQHYDLAQPLYEEAVDLARTIPDARDRSAPRSMRGLAHYHKHAGRFEDAEALLRSAEQVERGSENASYAGTLYELALLLQDRGRYGEAERLLLTSVRICRQLTGDRHPDVVNALYALSRNVDAGHEKRSLAWMQQAEAIQDGLIEQVCALASEHERLAYLEELRGQLHAFVSLVVFHLEPTPEVVRSAFTLLLRRKGLAARVLSAQRGPALHAAYPALTAKLEELSQLRTTIAHANLRSWPAATTVPRDVIEEWDRRREALEQEIAKAMPSEVLEHELARAGPEQLAAALPAGSALVEFVRFDRAHFGAVPERHESRWSAAQYAAFVLRSGEPQQVRMALLGDAEPIDALIAQAQPQLSGRHFGALEERLKTTDTRATQRLRETVFDPLVPLLRGARRLFLAPEGDLCLLPFDGLPLDAKRWVADDWQITYLATGRDLTRFARASQSARSAALVVADPDFELRVVASGAGRAHEIDHSLLKRGGTRFDALPQTRQEGEQVARLLGVQPLLGHDARKTAVTARRSPVVLHVATHGIFLACENSAAHSTVPGYHDIRAMTSPGMQNPLFRSGLALAGANAALEARRGGDASILTAWEVTGMDLLGTEIVVLSACETGVGHVHVGEGVLGMRQAFEIAGAQTLVMSLWRVDDAATRELMVAFWRNLREKGMSCCEALRAAQRHLRRTPQYAHPRYWAGFICQGDPAPLSDAVFAFAGGRDSATLPNDIASPGEEPRC